LALPQAYVRAVLQLAQQYHKSPDLISEENCASTFLFFKNVKAVTFYEGIWG